MLSTLRAAPADVVEAGAPLDLYGGRDGRLYVNGKPFRFKGLNWYGSEGGTMVPEGLDKRRLGDLLDFLVEHNFNSVRLLFNMQDWRDDPPIPASSFSMALNPQLIGSTYRQGLRAVVRAAAARNILVLLACHRLRRSYPTQSLTRLEWPGSWDGYWFDKEAGMPMGSVIGFWEEISANFCGEWRGRAGSD